MNEQQEFILRETFKKRNNAFGNQNKTFNYRVAQFKAGLENMPGIDVALVSARPKGAISISKKVLGDAEKYDTHPDQVKDFLGFMVVTKSVQDGAKAVRHVLQKYGSSINPYSDKAVVNTAFNPIPRKGYSTEPGYKNFRMHIISESGYPTEIQVKTKEQYVAHMATHDPIYKSPFIKDEKEIRPISDALFPYFEATAYLQFNAQKLSPEETASVEKDIEMILKRTEKIRKDYPEVFNDACVTWATYCFVYNHHKELFADATFRDSQLQGFLVESDISRVFKHVLEETELAYKNQLAPGESFQVAVQQLAGMSYEEYLQREELSRTGNYKQESCVVSGVFDLLRKKDVEMFEHLQRNYDEVYACALDDEFAQLIGPVVFDQKFRSHRLSQIKGITAAGVINKNGEITMEQPAPALKFGKPAPKEYGIVSMSGVADGLHFGHLKQMKSVSTDKLYYGVKSDRYVHEEKHKPLLAHGRATISSQEDRVAAVGSIIGVEEAYLTENDILPPQWLLDKMQQAHESGERVAIAMGSDWFKHRERKSERSLAELEKLQTEYPFIELINCGERKEMTEEELAEAAANPTEEIVSNQDKMSSSFLRTKFERILEEGTINQTSVRAFDNSMLKGQNDDPVQS